MSNAAPEDIAALVHDAAEMLAATQCRPIANRPAWLLSLCDGCDLDIEFDDQELRLVVACVIGHVAETARESTYRVLLQYNFLGMETGGLRMALGPVLDAVVLMLDLATTGLSAARLCAALSRMSDVAQAWREILGSDTFVSVSPTAAASTLPTLSTHQN